MDNPQEEVEMERLLRRLAESVEGEILVGIGVVILNKNKGSVEIYEIEEGNLRLLAEGCRRRDGTLAILSVPPS